MNDLSDRVAKAREHVQPDWSPELATALQSRVVRRVASRRRRRRAMALVGVFVLVMGGWLLRSMRTQFSQTWEISSGVTASLRDASSVLSVRQNDRGRVVVDLVSGSARFSVNHAGERVVRIEAGDVAVQVLGTLFTVERLKDGARVSVERGRVRVFWSNQFADLGPAQSGQFPQAHGETIVDSAPTAESVPIANSVAREQVDAGPTSGPALPTPRVTPTRSMAARRGWREHADSGDFAAAWRDLSTAGSSIVGDDAADLLLAADVARMTRHPQNAADYYRRVLTSHIADPHASAAAFMLGRVLLDDLGDPRGAADAFARARSVPGNASLHEDALAREVEAANLSHDEDRARRLATEYLRLYPHGVRDRAVRHFGHLE